MQNDWLSDAKQQLLSGRLEQAYTLALEQLSEVREDGNAWGIMSLVALEGGNHTKSLELSSKALSFGTKSALVIAGRGRALLETGRQNEARKLAASVELDQCETALEADTVGVILARTGLHKCAAEFFSKAVELDNDKPQFHYNLATSLQFNGDLDGAKAAYRTLLNLDPAFHRARLALVQLEQSCEHDLRTIEQLFDSCGSETDSALQLGHAAAKICEAAKDHAGTINWLLKAKAPKLKEISHDRAWTEQIFEAASKGPTTVGMNTAATHYHSPLFIVGMPRSGTTLVERIISSHSAAATAGELPDLALLVKRSTGTSGKHTLAAEVLLSNYNTGQVGEEYLSRTASLAGNAKLLIDKMPFNFFFARHILDSLPEAKIVMVRRDPRDVVFANFRQLFATDFGYYNYAYDLSDTAHFVAQFEKLADQWHSIFPADRFHEVHYEDLIADQERESRRLIAFTGLEWEEQCLQFHRNAAPVATASSIQVRSPIHARSIGQWRKYGAYGDMVDQRLQEFGITPD
ncbi:tetratricopeptide repeat-containing sulfotransferase family protein [Pontixanthobacter gangjinensis]|uniref:Sulfotransferase family protein n=1 Tax=Pontixanthobacter gangjinensis TaxID=1028742 RepID=A0A6I4SR18_9SPHN|nr:sulfotransferase family protein [Pontixanthobacter gangjinensis]MXO57486.1 sulfotransferase family protein [Pontixanthobacter gangjinensis]